MNILSLQVITELLVQLNGVDASNEGVQVIATSAQPWEIGPKTRRLYDFFHENYDFFHENYHFFHENYDFFNENYDFFHENY